MITKYVCYGLISVHVNFHDNRLKRTVFQIEKFAGGGKKKSL